MNFPEPSPTAQPARIAIVGGGLSGMAAAHRLLELKAERGLPLTIDLFEAGPRLGGLIETRRIGDYLVELGADSFVTNKPGGISLCERLGLAERLMPTNDEHRRSFVLSNGRPVATPEGFTLLAPSRLWPILRTPLLSPWGKLRMGMEYFIPRRRSEEEESLAQFVRRRFGSEALARLVQPMVGGIYTSDPEKLSLQATMPQFVEMERQHGSVIRALRHSPGRRNATTSASGARYGLFVTLQDGMSELLVALEQRIRNDANVHLQRRILQCSPLGGQQYQLSDEQGSLGRYDGVVLALSTYRAAELLQPINVELANRLNEIEYASTAIVCSGHRLADIRGNTNAFGMVIPAVEKRRILAVSFSSRKFAGRAPEGRILLRTFVGGAMQSELLDQADESLQQLVLDELSELLGVGGRPEFCELVRYPRAMPQYHVGHSQRVDRIRQAIRKWPHLELAGNAYDGVGIPDSIASGERAAERVLTSHFYGGTSGESEHLEESNR